ncbi:MAG: hypothetical protein V3S56_00415, partial [Gemmatimonadota bacterium]
THGTNRLFDEDPDGLLDVVRTALLERRDVRIPPLWDGKAAERIARITISLEDSSTYTARAKSPVSAG